MSCNSVLSHLKYFLECEKQFGTWQDRDDTSGVSGMAGLRWKWWREAGFANPMLDPLTLAKEKGNHISFLPSAMLLKCSEGLYLTYKSEIFPDLRRKKQVFVDQYLGLFLVELGLFCHFVPGLLAIALGPKPSPVTRIAGIDQGTRLHHN